MLLALAANILVIFLLLCLTELLWRRGRLHVETSRKIVHIGTGILIAFWPYILSWTIIQVMALVLLAVILISYKLKIFQSIHSIKRLTVGEILYPVGIFICAMLEPAPWVFTVAILHLTLADGLAAIVGVHFGKKYRYHMFGHIKSLAGTATFFVTSFLILVGASLLVPDNSLPPLYAWFLWTALGLTIVENISWYGLDDITVPVAAICMLTLLAP